MELIRSLKLLRFGRKAAREKILERARRSATKSHLLSNLPQVVAMEAFEQLRSEGKLEVKERNKDVKYISVD